MILAVLLLIPSIASSVSGESKNFFFVTHSSYATSTLSSVVSASTKISGSVASVTEKCRRNCALNPSCQAFDVKLTKGTIDLGSFTCIFFELNACNWATTGLTSTPLTPTHRLWEKLVSQFAAKPKACSQYYGVIYKGNCQAYRGFPGFTGLDCDIAPRSCSDFQYSGWASALIWPWGFNGRSILVHCYFQYTRIFVNDRSTSGYNVVGTINPSGFQYLNCYNKACVDATIALADWTAISQLAFIVPREQFIVLEAFTSGNLVQHTFSGVEITAFGELSLNSTQDTVTTGFPIPLSKAPFVYPTVNSSCSAFWQFESNVSVCSQQTHLLNFGSLKWNGIVGQNGLSIFLA